MHANAYKHRIFEKRCLRESLLLSGLAFSLLISIIDLNVLSSLIFIIGSVKEDAQTGVYLKEVGRKIRAVREKRGWTLVQMEERGWPDWTHLQKIEAGKNFTIATLYRVAKVLQVSPSDLLKV